MAALFKEKNTSSKALQVIGQRLRAERIKKQDTQAIFAARIGVSVPTLRKMEQGDATVQIGHWAEAFTILGRESELVSLLAPKEDLFTKFSQFVPRERKRVSRKKSSSPVNTP